MGRKKKAPSPQPEPAPVAAKAPSVWFESFQKAMGREAPKPTEGAAPTNGAAPPANGAEPTNGAAPPGGGPGQSTVTRQYPIPGQRGGSGINYNIRTPGGFQGRPIQPQRMGSIAQPRQIGGTRPMGPAQPISFQPRTSPTGRPMWRM